MKKYAVILAGGTGKRMGDVKLPKQFLEICNVPIIILTIKKILSSKLFDFIYIVIHKDWFEYLDELLINANIDKTYINFILGGK